MFTIQKRCWKEKSLIVDHFNKIRVRTLSACFSKNPFKGKTLGSFDNGSKSATT